MLIVMQRYIATRPMFMDVKELVFGSGGKITDTSSAITAMRTLSTLYKGMLTTVKEEAVVMEQVFPSPDTAMQMLVQRVFEQRVQVGVHKKFITLEILILCKFTGLVLCPGSLCKEPLW